MEKNKLLYESPQLTVVEFKVEQGFAGSSDHLVINTQQMIQDFIDKEVHNQSMGQVGDGGVIAAGMGDNEDHSDASSGSWQYSNGGWF